MSQTEQPTSTVTPEPDSKPWHGRSRLSAGRDVFIGNLLPSSVDVVVVSAYLASLTSGVRSPDIFWHIKTGELITHQRDVPRENLYSFVAQQTPWVDTEWLAQVCLYAVSETLGPHWLLLLRGVCFALAVGLLYRLLRRMGGVLPSLGLSMIALLVALPFLEIGPSMVALPFFMLELTLLEDLDWRRQSSMFLLPILFLVWANLHGSFFLGLMLLVLHIAGSIWDWREGKGDSIWFYHLMGLLPAVLFSLWNPYYSKIYLVGLGKVWEAMNTFPMVFSQPSLGIIFLLIVLFTVASSYLVRHTMKRRMMLPLLGLGAFVIFHREAMAEAVILAVVAIMQNLQTLAYTVRHEPSTTWRRGHRLRVRLQLIGERLKEVSAFDRRLSSRTYIALTAVLTMGLFSLPAGKPTQILGMTFTGISFEEVVAPAIAPTDATSFLLDAAFPQAKVLMPIEAAGYVIYRGYPVVQVFADTRLRAYPQEVLQDYLRFASRSPGWEEVLDLHEVDFIMWHPYAFQPRALVTGGGWRLLHADPYMVVLGRSAEGQTASIEDHASWGQLVGAVVEDGPAVTPEDGPAAPIPPTPPPEAPPGPEDPEL